MGHPSTNYTTTSNDNITQSVLSAFPFGGATRTTPQVQTPTREVSTVSNDSGYSSDEEDVYAEPPTYHEPSTDNVNKKRKTTTTTTTASIFGRLTSFLPTSAAAIVSDSDGDGDGDGDDDDNGNSVYYLYDHRPAKRIRHDDDFFASSSSSQPMMQLSCR